VRCRHADKPIVTVTRQGGGLEDNVQKNQSGAMFLLALAVAVMAFAGGALSGFTLGRGSLLDVRARVAQITSGALDGATKDADIPPVTNLNALAVIWEVRDKVLSNFVHPLEPEQEKKLTYGAIRGMLASLDDPFSRFLDPEEYRDFQTDTSGHFDGIGAQLEARVNLKTSEQEVFVSAVLPEGPASKTNLRPGDVIVRVNKDSTRGLTITDVVDLIRGPRGTEVTLTVTREGTDGPLEIKVVRANIEIKAVEYEMKDQENKIGYIWLRQFNQKASREMRAALDDLTAQGMKGLVLDLSMDPGGLLEVAVEVASNFIPEGPVVWIKNREGDPRPLNAIRGLPMVVLIDGGSASASEILAGALQDLDRATICGQHSFGKAKVQTIMELQDDSALFLTTALYLTPHKRDIGEEDAEGNPGVKPDRKFPDPDPNDTDLKFEEWHKQQVGLATDVLQEKMGLK